MHGKHIFIRVLVCHHVCQVHNILLLSSVNILQKKHCSGEFRNQKCFKTKIRSAINPIKLIVSILFKVT